MCITLYIYMHISTKVFGISRETCIRLILCLQTCNSVVNMLVMGLVLGKSLMAISTTDIL